MQDRDKLAQLFDAALQEMDAPDPRIAEERERAQAEIQLEHARQQQAHAQHQEYLRQQQLHAQHQEYLRQQQAYAQHQEYLRQQQLHEQHQEYLRQQHLHAQHQAQIQLQQQQAALMDMEIPAEPLAAVRESDAEAETLPATTGFTVPAASGSAFVFMKKEAPAAMGASEEFAGIMEAKMAKTRRKRSRSFVVTLILFFVPTLGGAGWFISSPDRVQAVRTTLSEIRSAGDIKAIMASYQRSLDKVAVRGQHIDEASSLLGVDPTQESGGDDAHFEKEMSSMAGPDGGPTVTQRNRLLREKFGAVKTGGSLTGGTPAQ